MMMTMMSRTKTLNKTRTRSPRSSENRMNSLSIAPSRKPSRKPEDSSPGLPGSSQSGEDTGSSLQTAQGRNPSLDYKVDSHQVIICHERGLNVHPPPPDYHRRHSPARRSRNRVGGHHTGPPPSASPKRGASARQLVPLLSRRRSQLPIWRLPGLHVCGRRRRRKLSAQSLLACEIWLPAAAAGTVAIRRHSGLLSRF
jgi:hypothetical protein